MMNNDGRDGGDRPSCMLGQMMGNMGGVPNMMMMNHNMNFNNIQMPMVMMGPDTSMTGVGAIPGAMGNMAGPPPPMGGQGMMGGLRGMGASAPPAMGAVMPLMGPQMPSSVIYPTPSELQKLHRNTMNNATSNTMVLSLATFLQQWMNGYTTFDDNVLVTGTLSITVDGRDKNKYCVNEKLYKSEGDIVNVLSSSYHYAQKDVEVSRWAIGQETLPTPHEKDPFIEHQDSASINDQDMWGGSSNDHDVVNYSHKAVNYSHKADDTYTNSLKTDAYSLKPAPIPQIPIPTPSFKFETDEPKKKKKKAVPIDREPKQNEDIKEEQTSHASKDEESSICEKCGESFKDKWSLLRHKKSHLLPSVQSLKCETCGKRYTRTIGFQNHKCGPKAREKLSCRFCGISFVQVRSLKRHVLTHADEAPFKCDVCGKTFGQPSVFKLHMGIHTGEVPYECKVCNRGYRTKLGLMQHEREHSETVKPFICDQCGLSFIIASRLQEHMRTHKDPILLASQPYLSRGNSSGKSEHKSASGPSDHQYANDADEASLSLSINPCTFCKPNEDAVSGALEELYEMLPSNYKYLLCKADPQYITDSEFTTQFAINAKTKEEIQSWLEEFSNRTRTTFNIKKTQKVKGVTVLFKQYLYCNKDFDRKDRKTKLRQYRTKKTGCEVKMKLLLNRCNEIWLSNPHHSTYPTTINLKWGHNHSMEDSLSYHSKQFVRD